MWGKGKKKKKKCSFIIKTICFERRNFIHGHIIINSAMKMTVGGKKYISESKCERGQNQISVM